MGGNLLIDDRASGTRQVSDTRAWRCMTDTVMGGVSTGKLEPEIYRHKPCLHMTGAVSLENNGGFVQASLDLADEGYIDASHWRGIEIEVCGNAESYNLHLRTADTRIVWQSYRAGFMAVENWQTLQIPFAAFQPHRIDVPLDCRHLRRLGMVVIGRAMQADLYFARIAFYR